MEEWNGVSVMSGGEGTEEAQIELAMVFWLWCSVVADMVTMAMEGNG